MDSLAMKSFRKALKIDPQNALLLNLIGLSYYNQGAYMQAYAYYHQSYTNGGTRETYLNNLGLIYAKLGRLEDARRTFEKMQKLTPEDSFLYRNWTVYYALMDNKPMALENLEKAILLGYDDLKWINREDSFESIRAEVRYKKIIGDLEAKLKMGLLQ
jgi:Flp pilus assembly protein TadD, contains TPR repeats